MSIFSKLLRYNDIGIDLGAANMRVWVRGKGLVLDEPSVVALPRLCNLGSKPRIFAVGAEAVKLIGENDDAAKCVVGFPAQQGRSSLALARLGVIESGAPLTQRLRVSWGAYPKSCDLSYCRGTSCYAVWPRKGHIIADVEIVSKMLNYCFAKARNAMESTFRKPRVAIAVPADITEVERVALKKAAYFAGAGRVLLFDARMAAALGVGCDAYGLEACMLVDIGASMMTIALVSPDGIACSRSLRVGGDELNNAIVKYMRNRHKLLVGEREAEDLKIKIGAAQALDEELDCEISGSDLVEGRRRTLTINSREIREGALDRILARIEDALSDFLKFDFPGNLAKNLARNGFVLTGGGSLLRGLDKRLADATGLPAHVFDDPAHATIRGIGVVLDKIDFLLKYTKRR